MKERMLMNGHQRFHLDERTHPKSELINTALAKYQGPALLAYNNAIFREKDFESLSRLGNSLKLQDGLTTGKFGRGFNSVSLSSSVE
jgi:sacsin